MIKARLLMSAVVLTAVGTGISAVAPRAAAQTTRPAAGETPAAGDWTGPASPGDPQLPAGSIGPGEYILRPMPAGTVMLERDAYGNLLAHVAVLGLTPGSSHDVLIEDGSGPELRFSTLTADSGGKVNATLTAAGGRYWRAEPDSRLVILLGTGGGALAGQPIALTRPLAYGPGPFRLHAVTAGDMLRPSGVATISYHAAAKTLIVTVNAFGLTPGAHAAHIHLGSCLNQGPVKYALADFIADSDGDVIDQSRVVTGVTSVPRPGNWYLNLHQGNMNQILANGTPTLLFRPMLCADLTSFGTRG